MGLKVAEVSHKIKISPPKPWKGTYNQLEQDGWIRTVKGYLVSVGLDVLGLIVEDLALLPFHTI